MTLPSTAIGKDFLPGGQLAAWTPSGTGFQLSFAGIIGLTVAVEEGLELNLLGLVIGVDPRAWRSSCRGWAVSAPADGGSGLPDDEPC